MANKYWVGGSGIWDPNPGTHWAATSGGAGGQSAPLTGDNAIFDQPGTYTVTTLTTSTCLDLTVSAGSVTFTGSAGNPINIYGSVSLVAGTVWGTTGTISFLATTSKTITTNGTTLNADVRFYGTGGTWTLGSNLTLGATSTISHIDGTIALGGFTLTTGAFLLNSVGVARTVAFGTSSIVLAHTTAATIVLDAATATGFTWTGTGGFVSDAAITRTFRFGTSAGGSATNAPNLTLTGSGTAILTFTTASWFNKLDFGTTAFAVPSTVLSLNALTLSSGGTFTSLTPTMVGTGTLTPNGKTIAALTINTAGTVTLAGALACTTYTQTLGTINFATFNLTCSSTVSYVAGTLSNIGTINCTTWNVNGTFTMTNGTITPSVSFVVSNTFVFNYNGGTLSPVPAFTHNGTVSLGQSYALTATGTYTIGSSGSPTLNLNGYNLSTGIFLGNNGIAVTYNIAFGTGNIILTHTTAGTTVLSLSIAQNFNSTGTGGFVTDASITRTIDFGGGTGKASGMPNLTLTGSGTAVVTVLGGCFNKVDFGTTAFIHPTLSVNLNSLTLSTGGTYTGLSIVTFGTGVITTNGKSIAGLQIGSIGYGYTAATTLAGALSLSSTFSLQAGSINFANFNLTCSADVSYQAGTLSNIGTITCTTWTIITGTFTLTSGTITPSVSFVLQSGAFNYNGGTLSPVPAFSHQAGILTLGKSYALTATGDYAWSGTGGTINLNGFNLTTGSFTSSNSATRLINFGTGNIILAHTTAGTTVLNMGSATNFTSTGTGGFTSAMSVARSFSFGNSTGSATSAVNLFITSGASVPTFSVNSWFKLLDFTGSTCTPALSAVTNGIYVDTLTLASGGTYTSLLPVFTRTQTWTAQFSKQLGGIGFNLAGGTLTLDSTQTYAATSTTFLTAGTLDLGGTNLTTGIFSSNNINTRSIAFGSNNIILATTVAGVANIDMGTATGFTWTGTGGFTSAMSVTRQFSFGDVAGGTFANAPNISITSGASAPLFNDRTWFNKIDFTGSTCTPAMGGYVTGIYVDTLTLASGGTYTSLLPVFTRTQTWTAQFGKTFYGMGVNIPGGTFTLDNTQTFGLNNFTLTAGTLDLGGYDLTIGTFLSSNSNTRSIAFGSNKIRLNLYGITVLDIATANGFTWTGTGGFIAVMDAGKNFQVGITSGGTSANAPNLWITSGINVPTIVSNSWFNILDFTGSSCTPALTSVNINSLMLSTGGTFTSLTANMIGTGSIKSTGKTLAAVTINAYGQIVQQSDALTLTGALTVTSGSFVTNGYAVTASQIISNVSGPRSISLGSSSVTLSNTTAAFLVTAASTGLAFNAGTSTVNLPAATTAFPGLGYTYYDVSVASGTSTVAITNGNTFHNFTVAGLRTVTVGNVQTFTGSLVYVGAPTTRLTFTSDTLGTPRTVVMNGAFSSTNIDFRDIAVTGTSAPISGSTLGDLGGNSGITFTSKTVYWNLAGAQNWDATGWATSSGGTPNAANFPLAQDTAVFDNTGSVTGTITFNLLNPYPTIDMSARTTAMTLNTSTVTASIYGDWKNGSGTTLAGISALTFVKRGTQTIASAGKTFPTNINFDTITGTVLLADAFNGAGSTSNTSGIFNAGIFNFTAVAVNNPGTIYMGSGLWTITGAGGVWNSTGTLYQGTADILLSYNSTSARTFTGGGKCYNKLTIGGTTGTGTTDFIGANTFTELASTKTIAHTVALSTTAQAIGKWTITGTVGNVVTVTGAGSHSITGDRVTGVDYLALGTTSIANFSEGEFYAGANSTATAPAAPLYLTAAPTATTRYWVGGTGTWDATTTTNWSATSGGAGGASVPTSADNVIFDSLSNATAYTVTQTQTGAARCANFTMGAPPTGNITFASGSSYIVFHGNVSFSGGANITRTYTGNMGFASNTTGWTFNPNGVTFASQPEIHSGGWSLTSALTTTSNVVLIRGSLNTAGYAVSAASINSSFLIPRTLSLGASTVTLSGASPISFGTQGLTLNAGTSTLSLTNAVPAFTGAGFTYYNVTYTVANTTALSITGTNTFNNLTFTGGTTGVKTVSFAANQMFTGALTTTGTTATARIAIQSDVTGTTRTFTANSAASISDVDFQDIAVAGMAAPISGTRIGDLGGNSGITTSTPKTVYWNLAGAQNWNATGWAATSGGTPAVNNFPLAQDTAVFDNTGSVTGAITSVAAYAYPTVDMSARTSAMTFTSGVTTINSYGDWKNGSGTTITGASGSVLNFAKRGTQTITSASKTFTSWAFTVNSINGIVQLADALIISGPNGLTITSGTFNNIAYTATVTTSTGATVANSAAAILNIGTGGWVLSGTSGATIFSAGALSTVTYGSGATITIPQSNTFAGGGKSYPKLIISGGVASTLTITGNNTFAEIASTKTVAASISLASTIQTVGKWTAAGTVGNLLSITGTSSAVPAHLILTGSTPTNVDYLSISNVRVAPLLRSWYAGTHSVDGGGLLGWIFTAVVIVTSLVNSGFFAFF